MRIVGKQDTQFKAKLNTAALIRCELNGFRFVMSQKLYQQLNLSDDVGCIFMFDDDNKKVFIAQSTENCFYPKASTHTGYRFTSKHAFVEVIKMLNIKEHNFYLIADENNELCLFNKF
jgi:hypothetical protein